MSGFRNVFACLVHESQECVIDLVRNLRHLDPDSVVLLYNGGKDEGLLNHSFPFAAYGAVVHPKPRPMEWGRLHDFALDCMQFALEQIPFDALTIVDSDQLAARPGYSEYLGRFFAATPEIGLAGNCPTVQPRNTRVGPAVAAFKEIDLWRPFLSRFQGGVEKFVHWTFWPSTVFSGAAARDLTRLFATDQQLQDIMSRSQIWASEEIVFPTLVALLGYQVVHNPCTYEYVKHRVAYSPRDLDVALSRPSVFWIHPVNRQYGDRLRGYLRRRLDHYDSLTLGGGDMPSEEARSPAKRPLLLTMPILQKMRTIEGWLEDDEADVLIAATMQALAELPGPHAVVEVGSYCGRSTVVFGSVLKAAGLDARVHAVDPHDGIVGALDQGLRAGPSTLERFERNITDAGLRDVVVTVQQRPYDVRWEQPISLLFIDGLHDYANVARDFFNFEASVVPGGSVAFHDCADYYPGVKAFVNELLRTRRYEEVAHVGSLKLLRKRMAGREQALEAGEEVSAVEPAGTKSDGAEDPVDTVAVAAPAEAAGARVEAGALPTVSCIMPTGNRRSLVAQAVEYFRRQDYPHRELVIVDDGDQPADEVVRRDPRIRYLRLDRKATIGAKRNLACRQARGEIVVHWDDDDWHGPSRLRHQVEALLRGHADVCGLDRLFFYEPLTLRSWEYQRPESEREWVAGGTMCYRKSFWKEHPFSDVSLEEDTRFQWSDPKNRVLALPQNDFYVALVHPSNARPRPVADPRWKSRPVEFVRGLIGGDCPYYDTLFPVEGAGPPPRVPSGAPKGRRDRPFVSCIMPTFNRGLFVPQAIRCFLRQDYPDRELIVVDDGERRVGHLVEGSDLVRYVAVDRRLSLGEKRNLAAELSRGDVIAHWDDDDWYGPEYLSRLVRALLSGGPRSLAGISEYLVYFLSNARLKLCSARAPAGASFCYWRTLWDHHRYRPVNKGEDYFFMMDARPDLRCVSEPEHFAVVRHLNHTWARDRDVDVDQRLGRLPPYGRDMVAVAGAEDAAFYEATRRTVFGGSPSVRAESRS